MPVITEIQPQVKRQGYYNIHIDGKYTLSLSEKDLKSFQLKPGQLIDQQLLADLQQAYIGSKCYNYALRFISIRPRSISEVRDYLVYRKGFAKEDVERILEALTAEGYLNDIEFARIWIRNRLDINQKPLKIIRLELIKKNVDKDVIEACLSEVEESKQLEVLKNLITKKLRNPNYKEKQKLTEFLARRGYSYGLIQKAYEELTLFED